MKYKFLLIVLTFTFACGSSSQKTSDENQDITNEETRLEEETTSYPKDMSENKMESPSPTPPSEEEINLSFGS